jgi:hypothetical protein
MLAEVRVGFSLRNDLFEVVLACEPEQTLAVLIDVIAVHQSLAALQN